MKYIRSHRKGPPRGVGDCGPGRTFTDSGTGEARCDCINDNACNTDQNGESTGQLCNVAAGKCEP